VRARTLVTASHRLTLYLGADWGELYDLNADPLERHHLWEQEPVLRGALLERMVQKMMALADRSPRPTRIAWTRLPQAGALPPQACYCA
jgi:arylsulfatase